MLPLHTVTLTKPDKHRQAAKHRPATALLISVTLHLLLLLTLLLIPRPNHPQQNTSTTPQFTLHFPSDEDLLATFPAAPPKNETQPQLRARPPSVQPVPAPALPPLLPAPPVLAISATFAASEKADARVEMNTASIDFPQPKTRTANIAKRKSVTTSTSSSKLTAARPTKRSSPIYPELARKKGYQGTSVFIATINPDGSIKEVKLSQTSGHAMLDRAAKKALLHWRFTPAKRNGITIASQLRIPIIFRLG